jgi:4-aminobutyrate aminotransferase / (S)-3-amino-2-methylpropionate transaminase / 5-aminovalerate transaminase
MTMTKSETYGSVAARERFIPRGIANTHLIFAARAEGVKVWDTDGKEYLDFASGISVLNVGHRHPRVVRAVQDQLGRVMHTCFQVAMYEPYVELAARLSGLTAQAGTAHKAALFTTGAEACENAVKIARAFTNRPAVVAFSGGFHGRTLLSLTMTASSPSYRQNFGPFAPEVYHAPFPDEYHGWTTGKALAALEDLFATEVVPRQVAAVIVEPELGEGGFIPAPPEFLRRLRALTREHGIVLIVDEIQTGFGRTGKMFAYEHAGIDPDLVTMAKSLAAGLPLSAVVGRAEIMDAPLPGGLGGTYAGNPLACAAALAVLDLFEEEPLVEQGARLGAELGEGLLRLQQRVPQIGDVRGLGCMLAIELVKDRATREPDADLAQQTIERARAAGLLLLKCGPHKNVVRLLPPLVATSADVSRALEILGAAFAER